MAGNLRFGAALLSICWLSQLGLAQSASSSELSLGEKAYVASKIYSAINLYFAHWQGVPNLDLDSGYKEYLDKALKAGSRTDFDLATYEFIARLRNGHTFFSDKWMDDNHGQPLGFFAVWEGGKWVITSSRRADLQPGGVIQAIGERTMDDFFKQEEKYIPASTERWARRALFERAYLFPGKFTLALEGGKEVVIDRRDQKLAPPPTLETQGRWITEGTIGYIKVPSFGDPKFEEAAIKYTKEFGKGRSLLIDVRGNHGGSTPGQLTAALMDRPYSWYQESTTAHLGVMEATESNVLFSLTWSGETTTPENALFKGRVFILADAGCFSACEDFVVPFKANHRAVIIGEATGGSSGQPYMHGFGNGMFLGIGAKREHFPDGSEFEGVGVAPDVEVHPTPQDFRTGDDPVLKRAIEIASQP